jgi:alpha-tubulin suppressor-like RCC1 family protein
MLVRSTLTHFEVRTTREQMMDTNPARNRQDRQRIAVAFLTLLIALSAFGVSAPAEAAPLPSPVQVVAGRFFSCARMSDGTVRCWGDNSTGELGDGTTKTRQTPVTVLGLTNVTSLSAGLWHTCAIVSSGDLYCWGANTFGQLGDGTRTDRLVPVKVTPPSKKVRLVATAPWHTCAATTDHRLYCWGHNLFGSLGLGDYTNRLVPTLVKNLPVSPILSIGAGMDNTCVQQYGSAGVNGYLCTGGNAGMWGTGSVVGSNLFVRLGAIDAVPRVMVVGTHFCRLRPSDGWLRCTGSNDRGQLGNGTTTKSTSMVTVPGAFATVGAGWTHTCAYATANHEYRCWGDNSAAQLGIGSPDQLRTVPAPVSGFTSPANSSQASIAAGDAHTCAIGRDAALNQRAYCWGNDSSGQLGNGGVAGSTATPTKVVGMG